MNSLISGAPVLTAEQMRSAEQACFDAGTSQAELMERAGRAVANEAARFAIGRQVLVLAGPGNNGGDAYVAARLLRERGHDVIVAALGGKRDGAAGEMRERWTGETVSLADAAARPVVIDGLFGTGMSRPLGDEVAGPLRRVIDAAEFTLAIDLPSGVATDSGTDLGAASATATIALGALKPAHLLMPALERCGAIILADIGIPCASSVKAVSRPRLHAPGRGAHKYSRGLVVVIGGEMPGASRLAARAALHGGAGYVMLAGENLTAAGPDAIVHRTIDGAGGLRDLLRDERIASVVIGPGLGRSGQSEALLDAALACDHLLVVDGDALSLLGSGAADRFASRDAATTLTPHAGEFERMFGSGEGSKLDRTLAAAKKASAVVVHKGPDTVIASPDGGAQILAGASSWLSTAGTGDVLAGLCGARCAVAGAEGPAEAAWLHARAAELAGPAFAADDLIAAIPAAIGECL